MSVCKEGGVNGRDEYGEQVNYAAAEGEPCCPDCGVETGYDDDGWGEWGCLCASCVSQAAQDAAADRMADRIADGYLPPGTGA